MVNHILQISAGVALMILASCAPLQNAIPTPVLSTHTFSLTNTPPPATDTPRPTSLPSATPLSLTATGPWGVVKTDTGIWAFNADGEACSN